jgi:hypothetical protein
VCVSVVVFILVMRARLAVLAPTSHTHLSDGRKCVCVCVCVCAGGEEEEDEEEDGDEEEGEEGE